MKCPNFSVALLVAINVITALFGLGLIGASGYGLATFEEWADFVSMTGLTMVMVFGCGIFFVSVAGCCGALKQNKWLLAIYAMAMAIMGFLILGGGIAVLMYGADVCTTCQDKLAARELSQVVIKVYKDCCGADTLSAADIPCKKTNVVEDDHDHAAHGDSSDDHDHPPKATADTEAVAPLNTCVYPKCNGNGNDLNPGCVKVFTNMDDIVVPNSLCKSIEILVFNKDASDTTPWNSTNPICHMEAGGTLTAEEQYTAKVSTFVQDNMRTLGTGLVVLSSFLIVMMFAACGVCCHKRDDFDPKANTAAYDPNQASVNGGNLAYGGPVKA